MFYQSGFYNCIATTPGTVSSYIIDISLESILKNGINWYLHFLYLPTFHSNDEKTACTVY